MVSIKLNALLKSRFFLQTPNKEFADNAVFNVSRRVNKRDMALRNRKYPCKNGTIRGFPHSKHLMCIVRSRINRKPLPLRMIREQLKCY